ncbi:helix-turn-helix domain-containing protein [Streptomyces uncialis]|nr:helix-turn-helix domain-containing protein [Streptomyces uncialis]
MDSDAVVIRRLIAAAARSGARLIAEAAHTINGWAVLADPIAGAIYSTPPDAAEDGIRAAAAPPATDAGETTPVTVHPVAGAALVLCPGTDTSSRRADLVATATTGLLDVRARRTLDLRPAEIRLHTAAVRLLLRGETTLAHTILGTLAPTATVYRLTGPDPQRAHHALRRALQPTAPDNGEHTLLTLQGGELTVIALHPAADNGRVLRLIARAAERHHLLGGVADPCALDMITTAWDEAGQAQTAATPGHRLAPVTGLGDRALLRLIPPDRLTAWARTLLHPLDTTARRLLNIWLRTASIGTTAHILGVSRATVRTRLRTTAHLLHTPLDSATTQAQLLLALRTPTPTPDAAATADPPPTRDPSSRAPLPVALTDEPTAHRWATTLLAPLDAPPLRIALRVWLQHLGHTAPAADALGLHRTTLNRWLDEITERLAADLTSPATRAELHLACLTLDEHSGPGGLPRRGGRTFTGGAPAERTPPPPEK